MVISERVNINHFSKYFSLLSFLRRRLHESHARYFMYFPEDHYLIAAQRNQKHITLFSLYTSFRCSSVNKKELKHFMNAISCIFIA